MRTARRCHLSQEAWTLPVKILRERSILRAHELRASVSPAKSVSHRLFKTFLAGSREVAEHRHDHESTGYSHGWDCHGRTVPECRGQSRPASRRWIEAILIAASPAAAARDMHVMLRIVPHHAMGLWIGCPVDSSIRSVASQCPHLP